MYSPLLAAWSLGGLLETPPRWHATMACIEKKSFLTWEKKEKEQGWKNARKQGARGENEKGAGSKDPPPQTQPHYRAYYVKLAGATE